MENKTAVHILAALAQETRLELFRLLVQQGHAGMNAGRIAQVLRIPNSTLSYHLAELEKVGLVLSEKVQRHIIYRADYAQMEKFLAFLVEDCCQGSGEICLGLSRPLHCQQE
ncbi:ArsR/SmtB family transcription factor [Luteithermobacter gelatinilyticus]|uniref:ArsR/SmtB family transcription factor n=1 Tax=Luteithermobacter gelatinilyticus TaxID=2582913 RepID=UPI001105A80D|nr:metalloregulator ArsR/SmtB family transcription factor [Luteithermobacter gelatinilyticus]|tara:strand:- start:9051 stop:9386 length:336 start_codon:yes stop_codon:yes gene_type:complete